MHENEPRRNENPFGVTYIEKLYDRMGEKHFLALMRADDTTIHQIEVSSNLWGEFLFVTASRCDEGKRVTATFWGLGFHERRDRYLTEEWYWYETSHQSIQSEMSIAKEKFEQQMTDRRQELEPFVGRHVQSKQGELFELLADLTDEDGAAAEIDDMDDDALDMLFGND